MLRRVRSGPRLRGQHGFSIVELMIAMLIALFLLGGLVTLVAGTRRSNGTQSAMSQLQDNERIAMTLITNVVQNAGYMPNPTVGGQTLNSFLTETYAGVSFSGSQVVGGLYNAAAPGDTFAIRFFAPVQDTTGTIINCAGQSNTSAANLLWYTNVFSVVNVNGTPWLQCQARSNNNGAAGTPQTVNLIPNVTKISVLYGLGSATGASVSDYSVVQYLNAAQVTAVANGWLYVTCIKVTLTFLLPQYGTVGGQMMSSAAPNSTITFQRVIPIMSRVGVNVI
jgi:type IV pilus assembly protein PilW